MGLASIPTRREHDDDHTVVPFRVLTRVVVTVLVRAHRLVPVCGRVARNVTLTIRIRLRLGLARVRIRGETVEMGLASIPTRREHDDDHTVVPFRVLTRVVVTVLARAHRLVPVCGGAQRPTIDRGIARGHIDRS